MRVGQTSLVHFLFNIFASLLGFVATIYFARVLGAGVIGEYALILSVVLWLQLGVMMGIPNSLIKRISEGSDEGHYVYDKRFICSYCNHTLNFWNIY